MSTFNAATFKSALDTLRQTAEGALRDRSTDEMEMVERQISRLDALAREAQQSMWAVEVRTAIRRLENNETLSEADLDVVRTFLISDAEQYLALENNFDEWVSELHRLIAEISQRCGQVDRHNIAELRGVLKDMSRLAPDIRNHLDEERRVLVFHNAVRSLDSAARKSLARLLRDQLETTTV
ncbi:MAG: hypothetical protein JNG88_09880 [Phycisphaerales bacterium]|nr:hypothetical protein [Phycisphaerales bacterium]